jgi:hypothetical protein
MGNRTLGEYTMALESIIETALTSLHETIMIGSYNDDHDDIISIHIYGGSQGIQSFTKLEMQDIDFQILLRDTSYSTGKTRAEAIFNILNHYKTTNYSILNKGPILSIGLDERNRSIFSMNFNCKQSL